MNRDHQLRLCSQQQFLCQLLAAVLLLNAVVGAIIWIALARSREFYENRSREQASNVVLLLAKQVDSTFDKSQMALLAARDEIELALARHLPVDQLIPQVLLRQQQRLPEVDAVRFTDAKGFSLYGSRISPDNRFNASDRPFFTQLRDHPDTGFFISSPIWGRISNQWTNVISLRCNRPDGSFFGVVTVNIFSRRFSELFQKLNLGSHGVAVLRDHNLNLAARYPAPPGPEGIGESTVSPRFRQFIQTSPRQGIFDAFSSVDAVRRTYAYRQTEVYPGYVLVGISEEETLAPWRQERNIYLLLGGLFLGLTLLATVLLALLLRRRQRIALDLEREKQYFHIIADYIYDWDYWLDPAGKLLYVSPSCQRVTGYTQAEMIADPNLIGKLTYPDDQPTLAKLLGTQSPHEEFRLDYRIVRKDGEVRWISRGCRSVFGEDAIYLGERVSNRDISDKVHAIEQLKTLARTDVLTGLANRRSFDDSANTEFDRGRRYGSTTSILILDIDHFKATNDQFGHLAGDDALVLLAGILKQNTRSTDLVARWGGEEFLVLLADTPLASTREFAERIRFAVAELEIPSASGSFHISVSIGCAEIQNSDRSWIDALARADHALYQAKLEGRNRVVVSELSD